MAELLQKALDAHDVRYADEAIALLVEAIRTSTVDEPRGAKELLDLTTAFLARFTLEEDSAALDDAVQIARLAVQAVPDGHPMQVECLDSLGDTLWIRLIHAGDAADLDEARLVYRQAVDRTDSGDPSLATRLNYLRTALWRRFGVVGDSADLDEAIRIGRRLVDTTGPGDVNRPKHLNDLGEMLRVRHDLLGDVVDLDEAVETAQQAVDSTAHDHPEWTPSLNLLATVARSRFNLSGNLDDLDTAIVSGRLLIDAVPEGARHRLIFVLHLADALTNRFELRGNIDDLNEAIRIGSQKGTAAVDDPVPARILSNLRLALLHRFGRSGELADLDEAVRLGREALVATPAGHPDLARHLCNLGTTLRLRFTRVGDQADIDEAVDVLRKSVEIAPPASADSAGFVSELGTALWNRASRVGSRQDLDEAVMLSTHAVDITPNDDPAWIIVMSGLGAALHYRFLAVGDLRDLDESIQVANRVLEATTPHHLDWPMHLHNLGTAYRERYRVVGDIGDLEEAILLSRQAVESAPIHDYDQALYLNSLAIALLSRFDRLDNALDLAEAVRIGRQAVSAAPMDHPDRARYLHNFAAALRTQFRVTEDRSYLEEMLDVAREAVESSNDGNPARALYLDFMGYALRIRFEYLGELDDLDAAVLAGQHALEILPPQHPDRGVILNNLGMNLRRRFELLGNSRDLYNARLMYREGAGIRSAPLQVVLYNAAGWGATEKLCGDYRASTNAYRQAVELLPQIAGPALARPDREHLLNQSKDLASRAAEAAAEAGDPVAALSLLEQGRGVLLTQALEARTDISELQERHPDLANRYTQVRDALLRDNASFIDPPAEFASRTQDMSRERRRLDSERNTLLAEIRRLPGFSTFQLPPDVEELGLLAAEGPVVAIIVGAESGKALICTSGSDSCGNLKGEVELVDLPAANQIAVLEQVTMFRAATLPRAWGRDHALRAVLGWLWENITGPVLHHLGYTQGPKNELTETLPRLWWMPTGPLVLLPLHAACQFPSSREAALGTRPHGAMDFVISSYTPTLRALQHARARRNPNAGGERSLVVGIDKALERDWAGVPILDSAVAEAEKVHELLAAADSILTNANATRSNVLDALQRASIAHFACHAICDRAPSSSRLVLYDEDLSVADIVKLHLEQAHLAFLSACRTADAGESLLDETIHIAGAFHLAGFTHVVGTLWPISDAVANTITTAIYNNLGGSPARAAYAVHKALRTLYMQHPTNPRHWAAYIHIGP
ncbi:CHAT domain-containing tetratricopeptide repeat protein [Nocardia terrae]|uniref:CHAT domain-containing tetratricopeptide repeat protein n=1 Tax=Nocardia terrae TaxID=2675851 RepID=UPI0018DF3C29|nr:CHAT domain-containing protein [Nocardia terrae]